MARRAATALTATRGAASAAALRFGPIVGLSLVLLGARLASAQVVAQPGYTDAYYYVLVAERLARGEGLTADFVWNFIEAPPRAALPVPSHRFWMPLATVLQAGGIAALGDALGAFRAAQAAIVALAALLPAAAYACARAIGAERAAALVTAALVGLGGSLAPGWVSLDSFVPAALLGSVFFIAYAGAARGDARAAATCGLAVGLLFLARAEAALFGLALLVLPGRARVAGSAIALAIGLAWLGRGQVLGPPPDLFARTALLVRYEDFFRIASPDVLRFVEELPTAAGAKAAALLTNATTALFAFALVLVPGIVAGARVRLARADVRAFVALAVLVYLAQSLVWTLHSTRGSYFHSLAAFFPFGVALGVVGTRDLLASRAPGARAVAAAAAIAGMAVLSASAVIEWDRAFNGLYATRRAALPAIPDGPFLAIDAAAWRWISGRSVVVTPADGIDAALCALVDHRARAIVLEPAHFSAYDALWRGDDPAGERFSVREAEGLKVLTLRRNVGVSCLRARAGS